MFPLADARGRVLGFGARAMRDDQRPKYMNTPEGELYHKRRQLFGIDRARAAAAKARQVIVVEGYTDVLALHAGGVAQSVAIMGTALTPEQFAELARAAGQDGTVVLALDADRAGLDAMLRAARAAEEKRIDLMVVELPDGQGPRRPRRRGRGGGVHASCSSARSRCPSSRRGGCWRTPTSRRRTGATARWTPSARFSPASAARRPGTSS